SFIDGETTPEETTLISDLLISDKSAQIYYKEMLNLSKTLKVLSDESPSTDLEINLQKHLPGVASPIKEDQQMKNSTPLFKYSGVAAFCLVLVLSMQVYHNSSTRSVREISNIGDKFAVATDSESTKTPIQLAKVSYKDRLTNYPKESRKTNEVISRRELVTLSVEDEKEEFLSNQITESKDKGMVVDNVAPIKKDSSKLVQLAKVSTDTRLRRDNKQFQNKNEVVSQRVVRSKEVHEKYANVKQLTGTSENKYKATVANGKPSKLAAATRQYEPYYMQSASQSNVSAPASTIQYESDYVSGRHVKFDDEDGYNLWNPIEGKKLENKFNTEEYNYFKDNLFLKTIDEPLSTFSIDVDTASYSNIRRFLNTGQMPPMDSVRIEEMINYFDYNYPEPSDDEPFSVTTKAAVAPWNKDHQIVSIGIKGVTPSSLPPSNLVFLLDVSGSMNSPNKLPLLKEAFSKMVNQLGDNETVSIVVYAGAAGEVLAPTKGSDKQTILNALNNLRAGGSTAGGQGIELAYSLAKKNFIPEGNNRVILATDGDFNIGVSSSGALTRLIEEKRKDGIFLTILGFGSGNYKDHRMEQLANKGNGNYYYIDTINEANKVLVDELGSTLFTIAKDVKLQIEFNPAKVSSYRLIGYVNRKLANEDFNDDTKDAGELGAGHNVTALYEIIPNGSDDDTTRAVDALKYQKTKAIPSSELMTVKLRYKKPDENISKLIEETVELRDVLSEPQGDFAFASAVAEFGMILRNSEARGTSSYKSVISAAKANIGEDSHGYRQEFINLVNKANNIDRRNVSGIQFK
ncbi:MAG: Ca-activated chloride channel family protein, partial [Candidatus Omnitrophota bacterium]